MNEAVLHWSKSECISASRDIFPICRNPEVFRDLIDLLVESIQENCPSPDVIIGLESRGFIFGPPIASKLNLPFVPVRKKGKLPGDCHSAAYAKEYGSVSTSHFFFHAMLASK